MRAELELVRRLAVTVDSDQSENVDTRLARSPALRRALRKSFASFPDGRFRVRKESVEQFYDNVFVESNSKIELHLYQE